MLNRSYSEDKEIQKVKIDRVRETRAKNVLKEISDQNSPNLQWTQSKNHQQVCNNYKIISKGARNSTKKLQGHNSCGKQINIHGQSQKFTLNRRIQGKSEYSRIQLKKITFTQESHIKGIKRERMNNQFKSAQKRIRDNHSVKRIGIGTSTSRAGLKIIQENCRENNYPIYLKPSEFLTQEPENRPESEWEAIKSLIWQRQVSSRSLRVLIKNNTLNSESNPKLVSIAVLLKPAQSSKVGFNSTSRVAGRQLIQRENKMRPHNSENKENFRKIRPIPIRMVKGNIQSIRRFNQNTKILENTDIESNLW